MPPVNVRDFLAGVVFLVIGALFVLGARELEVGSAFRMGPGYFPLVLAGLLMVLGVVITARSFRLPGTRIGAVPWRGMGLILAAPAVFGLTVRGLGLIAAIALAVIIAAFASRRASLRFASLLTLGLTAFCVLVFSYGLGLPLRLKGPWLDF